MREVSKDIFYRTINHGRLNVHPSCTHTSPEIISVWKYLSAQNGQPYGSVFGKTVSETVDGKLVTRHFLA